MAGDTYYNSVILGLHCDGTNGSTTFTDVAPTPNTVTPSGNASISTAQSKFGGASAYFDGTGDEITMSNTSSFAFGTGDFTIEFWIYRTNRAAGYQCIYSNTSNVATANGLSIYLTDTVSNTVIVQSGGTQIFNGLGSISDNTWTHVAVSKTSGVYYLFINGTQPTTSVSNSNSIICSSGYPKISTTANVLRFYGYLDDFRVTTVGRYTSNFTAPTAAFEEGLPGGTSSIAGSGSITVQGSATLYKDISLNWNITGAGRIDIISAATLRASIRASMVGNGLIRVYAPATVLSKYPIHHSISTITNQIAVISNSLLHKRVTRSKTGIGSISFVGNSARRIKVSLSVNESLIYTPSINNSITQVVSEIISILLSDPTIHKAKNVVSEYINIIDYAIISINASISEVISISPTLVPIVKNIINILETINMISSITNTVAFKNVLIDVLNLLDAITFGKAESISETIVLTDAVISLSYYMNIVLESVIYSEIAALKVIHINVISDNINLIDSNITKQKMYDLLSDGIVISLPTLTGGEAYLAYLFSPETSSVSNYNNYNFDGCTKFKGKYLFYNKTGLYEYGGTTDNGALITSSFKTPAYDFGITNLKQIPAVYIGVTNSAKVYLKVSVDGKAQVYYALNKKTTNLQTQKVEIGKGLIGRYFQFEIVTEASIFNLESISFLPVILKRKK